MTRHLQGLACGVACLLALTAPAASQQPPQQQVPPPSGTQMTIRMRVVPVPTTVFDTRRQFVRGLKKDDFEVREDGQLQELSDFSEDEKAPIRATLLIDVSSSMRERLPEVKRAAKQFIRFVGANDLVRVVQFDTVRTMLADFTSDRAKLEMAINSAKVEGGNTALHNAIYSELADLDAERASDEDVRRHRALIILSDGDDSASGTSEETVEQKARRVDTIIYSLSLATDKNSASALLFQRLADLTGGDTRFLSISGLNKAYEELEQQLRLQYMLAYQPTNLSSRAGWRSIKVNVTSRKNVNLRYRAGYYLDGKLP